MGSADLMIVGGAVLVSAGDVAVVDCGAVAVAGGLVVDVGPAAEVAARWSAGSVVDASGAVVSPGYVDGHVHLAALGGYGRTGYAAGNKPGLFVAGGRSERITPAVGKMVNQAVDRAVVGAVAAVRLAAMLRCGYTGVVDAGGPGSEAVADAAQLVGIRAAVGPSLADAWHDDAGGFDRRADTRGLLAGAAKTLDELAGRASATLQPIVSAAGTQTSSDELLCGIAQLAVERDLAVHVHSHVSPGSVRDHAAVFGRGETERLAEAGLLNDRLTVMHAGALSDDDLSAFAAATVTVNYNPVGNALFGFGITGGDTMRRALRAGVAVVLGSDWSSAVTPPGEIVRAALMLQRDHAGDDTALAAHQALAAIGSGTVDVGRAADLVVTDITGLHHLGQRHPIPALAWRARPEDIRAVVVGGRVTVRDGQLSDLDERELHDAARRAMAQR